MSLINFCLSWLAECIFLSMKLVVDEHVAKVAEFMVRNVPAMKLQKVARGLLQLTDLIYSEEWFSQVSPESGPFNAFSVELTSLCSGASQRPQDTK